MKIRCSWLIALATVVLPVMLHAQVAMPPFTYTGKILSPLNTPYSKTHQVTVYAYKGDLLAQTSTFDMTPDGINFCLQIPMKTENANELATVKGDEITLRFYADGFLLNMLPASDGKNLKVGNPGEIEELTIRLGTDKNRNNVTDEYEAFVTELMQYYGIEGKYSKTADYDKDGVNNYQEYLRGTDPFVKDDDGTSLNLRILSMKKTAITSSKNGFVIQFVPPVWDRTYRVLFATSLTVPLDEWTAIPFSIKSPSASALREIIITKANCDEDSDTTCSLYIPVTAPTGFFRLQME